MWSMCWGAAECRSALIGGPFLIGFQFSTQCVFFDNSPSVWKASDSPLVCTLGGGVSAETLHSHTGPLLQGRCPLRPANPALLAHIICIWMTCAEC